MLQALVAAPRPVGTEKAFAFSRPVLEHAQARRDLHRALLGGNGRDMPDEIRN